MFLQAFRFVTGEGPPPPPPQTKPKGPPPPSASGVGGQDQDQEKEKEKEIRSAREEVKPAGPDASKPPVGPDPDLPRKPRPDRFAAAFGVGDAFRRVEAAHPNPVFPGAAAEKFLTKAREFHDGDQEALADAICEALAWQIPRWKSRDGDDWLRYVKALDKYIGAAGWLEKRPAAREAAPGFRYPDLTAYAESEAKRIAADRAAHGPLVIPPREVKVT